MALIGRFVGVEAAGAMFVVGGFGGNTGVVEVGRFGATAIGVCVCAGPPGLAFCATVGDADAAFCCSARAANLWRSLRSKRVTSRLTLANLCSSSRSSLTICERYLV